MGANLTVAKWSIDDYHRMIEAEILIGRKVELLDGYILEMSPEGPLHKDSGEGLVNYLRQRLGDKAWVREAGPITLENSEPEPDIAVVQSPRSRYRDHHPYPEEIFWLIEISNSTLSKDLTEKKRIYAQSGIPEYWVVAIKNREVYVFRDAVDGDYQYGEKFSTGTLKPIAFPEIEISLESLWSGDIY
ncbi:MAG: Uma2 family endonuclease [Chlorogloea purpurea SAG 13.99]|nr:Uma2 family endonuclease [Chlorogloea purpurea SAG 13.99]